MRWNELLPMQVGKLAAPLISDGDRTQNAACPFQCQVLLSQRESGATQEPKGPIGLTDSGAPIKLMDEAP